jgi:uncharacterized lipoprotein YmbA
MNRLLPRLAAAIVVALCAVSCSWMQTSQPSKRYFVLQAGEAGNQTPTASGAPSLYLSRVEVSPPFDGRNLILRRGPQEFEIDFYSEFLVDPGLMIRETAFHTLVDTGRWTVVTSASSQLAGRWTLEMRCNRLYGDYAGEDAAAVIELQVWLLETAVSPPLLQFQQTYSRRIPLADHSAAALVLGLNRGLNDILRALPDDLPTPLER